MRKVNSSVSSSMITHTSANTIQMIQRY